MRIIFVFILLTAISAAIILDVPVQSTRNHETIDLNRELILEYATTTAEQETGLGGRSSLAPNAAMLFVFERPGIQTFWMKGMRFPLDIVWINQGVVVDVATLAPPKPNDLFPSWHTSITRADRVLEMNAGMAKRLGLKRGVKILP